MKPLPQSENAVRNEAISLGLLGTNPSLKKPRAKLLACIKDSMGIQRSFNHVSILMVGITGAGKSATVNHLLGVNLAETSTVKVTTRFTKEYIVHSNDPQFEVEGLPLGLIDTPGFCDADSSKQDLCNVLCIHDFFRTHPTLSGRYANLILIFVKATDNRIEGENSDVGKSLRCIKQLGLVDPKNPNVVIVLTHVCSIRKKTDEAWTKELERIKSAVSKVVSNALKVRAPVVLIENMYEDCDLEHCGDYTRLPNDELQPENLYLACAEVLQKNKDSLGLITLNSIFVEAKKGPITHGHEFTAKKAKQDELDEEEKKMIEIFEKAANREFEDPIHTAMLQYINEQRLGAHEVKEVMEIAGVLERFDEGNPPNFESNSISKVEFDLDKEISPTGVKMLKEKFNMKNDPILEFSGPGRRNVIGEGYNILTDCVTKPVMKFDVRTKCGIAIPTCAKYRKIQQGRSFMDLFKNDKAHIQSRLKSLNVILAVKPNIYKMENQAGYNKKSSFFTSWSSTSEYSFLFEQRLFELDLKLGSYKDYLNHGLTFTEDFMSDVAKLPNKYDKSDDSCVTEFKTFFDGFGHFVVSSAYGGGSVEIKCSREVVGSTETSLATTIANLDAILKGLNEAEGNSSKDTKDVSTQYGQETKDLMTHLLTTDYTGGKAEENQPISDKKKLQEWKESLLQEPVMLTSELRLEPISTAVGCINSQQGRATYDALKDLLRSDIEIPAKEVTQKEVSEKIASTNSKAESLIQPTLDSECFPSGSVIQVQSKDGEVKQKKMVNLDVGDKVMGWDEKRNEAVFTKVVMFAHLEPDAVDVKYLKITLEDGNEITLSGNHLVMVGKQKRAILARKVKPGDIVFSVDENRKISPKKVLEVEKVIEQGIFCPITLSGNVIVDNVLASCYASVKDHVLLKGLVKISAHNMAHFGLMPMRVLHKLRSKWLKKIPNGQTIHPYLQWLCKLNHPCMVQ